jgi:molecular chaperone GrpE
VTQEQNPLDELQDDQVDLSSAAEGAPASIDALQQQVEDLKNEVAQAKEQSLRVQAEMQNIRRRAQQDVEKAHKFGLEKFVSDLLPVADNLERALASTNSGDNIDLAAVVEGVELTLKSLLDTLQRHQVEQINPEGEPFDPQLHQAMTAIENRDVEPNTVLNVFQRGYTLNGRLVRPAMVVVSKAPAAG